MFLCAISGVDGSGKSTFAGRVIDRLESEAPDLAVARLWLRYAPKQLPAGTVSSTVSSSHRGHPVKRVLRRSGLSPVWVRANTALYRRQLSWQLGAAQHLDVVIADRFVLDFVVDQLAAGLLKVDQVAAAASRLPTADLAVHLDVEDDELLRRLKPGDDGDRVIGQAARYRDAAQRLGMRRLDGRRDDDLDVVVTSIVTAAR